MKLSDVFTIIKPNEYRVVKNDKAIKYVSNLKWYDDLIFQHNQYDEERSRNWCTLYWPLNCISSLFNREVTAERETALWDYAITQWYKPWVWDSAEHGMIVNAQFNNKGKTKELIVRYEDQPFSKTFDIPLDKGLGIQTGGRFSSDFFTQIKAGRITKPETCKGNLWHIIALFKHPEWYQFVDSDRKASRCIVTKADLKKMLDLGILYSTCRVIVPIVKLT